MKIIKEIILVMFGLVVLFSCEKTAKKESGGCIRVKYIVHLCRDAVLQIEDPAYYHLGTDGWENSVNGGTYDHVFLTEYCNVKSEVDLATMIGAPVNRSFYIQMANADITDCVQCAAAMPNPPGKKLMARLSDCNDN